MNRAFLTSLGMVLGALAACGRPEARPSRGGRQDSVVARNRSVDLRRRLALRR